jgi:hypothetical protein
MGRFLDDMVCPTSCIPGEGGEEGQEGLQGWGLQGTCLTESAVIGPWLLSYGSLMGTFWVPTASLATCAHS